MDVQTISLAMLPQLDVAAAAYGALCSPLQISGASVFDIIITAILIEQG